MAHMRVNAAVGRIYGGSYGPRVVVLDDGDLLPHVRVA
jgi:hypothetical protein